MKVMRTIQPSRAQPKSIWGYDTRSWRSAAVMRTIDALNPLKKEEPFAWQAPCVVSSIAGLGDLFIHLPLIGGVIEHCRKIGCDVAVALRPSHVEIGRRCGWNVIPFDNGLEDFFKNPARFRSTEFFKLIRHTRARHPALWIDLTGSALSAVAIKLAGAKRLASRITRGGRSLVDHRLPHSIQENEYGNRLRVAGFLGCQIDAELDRKIEVRPSCAFLDSVVLCLTTASRWKNWPLANFLALIKRFPSTRFTIVGFRREVLPEEAPELGTLTASPNVHDCLDRLSACELVDLIACCRAVISNDTSAAHIANFFGKPGAVLFGPVSPHTFAMPGGLRVFHDSTCPLHPCVQWRCDNQANWCMRKIGVDDVAAHLATVLEQTGVPQPFIQDTERRGAPPILATASASSSRAAALG
jgi:ADP-heptose:LPS heptosyltransferase